MSNHVTSLSAYFAWLFKKYRELRLEIQTETYRIIGDPDRPEPKDKLKIQVVGTDKIFYWPPEYIAGNDHLLEQFSKMDIRTITYYATEEMHKPKFTILSYGFSDKLKRILFRIRNRKSN